MFKVLSENKACIHSVQQKLVPTLVSILEAPIEKIPVGMQAVCELMPVRKEEPVLHFYRRTSTILGNRKKTSTENWFHSKVRTLATHKIKTISTSDISSTNLLHNIITNKNTVAPVLLKIQIIIFILVD